MCFFCLYGSQGEELRNINSERLDWIRQGSCCFCQSLKGIAKATGPISVLFRDFPLSHLNTVALVFPVLPHTLMSQDRERECLDFEKDGPPLYWRDGPQKLLSLRAYQVILASHGQVGHF